MLSCCTKCIVFKDFFGVIPIDLSVPTPSDIIQINQSSIKIFSACYIFHLMLRYFQVLNKYGELEMALNVDFHAFLTLVFTKVVIILTISDYTINNRTTEVDNFQILCSQ